MSIFGNILSSIFNSATAAEQPPPVPQQAGSASSPAPSSASPAQQRQQTAQAPQASAPGATTTSAAPSAPVDVAAILDDLTRKSGEKDIQWRKSIVDLMKVLNLNSGLAARKQLAKELNYTGSTKDTATMNIWLHKQVMTRLAESGGKVPEDLKH